MVINSYGKSPFEIRDFAGKEFKEMYDNQGRLLFKNWNEIQGSLPLQFESYADYLKDYCIYGNTVQNGTPTPENPVEVQGVGEYDAELNGYKIPVTVSGVNLFDYNWLWTKENVKLNDYFNYITIAMKPNTEYTISNNYRINDSPPYYETALIVVNSETEISSANGGVDRVRTVTTASDGLLRIAYRTAIGSPYYRDIVVNRDTLADGTYYIQINEGSSASPYEPYHEPITTSVYVGSEPLHKVDDYADYVDFKRGVVVRNIKKIVLTGDENWREEMHNVNQNVYRIDNFVNFRTFYISNYNVGIYRCTHILYMYPYSSSLFNRIVFGYFPHRTGFMLFFSTKKSMGFDTVEKFKNFLAEQYELGQPVTIWYIAAEPEEEPLENLLPIQTIKGSDVLTADTTVQPSEIYIKGKIKSLATHI